MAQWPPDSALPAPTQAQLPCPAGVAAAACQGKFGSAAKPVAHIATSWATLAPDGPSSGIVLPLELLHVDHEQLEALVRDAIVDADAQATGAVVA
jgi:hypothetical protein